MDTYETFDPHYNINFDREARVKVVVRANRQPGAMPTYDVVAQRTGIRLKTGICSLTLVKRLIAQNDWELSTED